MYGSQVRNALPILLLVLAAGCGSTAPDPSTTPPPAIAKPEIDVDLANSPFFGSSSEAPVTIDVTVTNRADQPIRVRRIEVDSPGMTQYGIRRAVREFSDTLAPGETKSIPVFATAVRTVARPNEPLTLRAIVDLEAGDKRWRQIVTALNNRAPY